MSELPKQPRSRLLALLDAALARVGGRAAVRRALRNHRAAGPHAVLAVGKAAEAMLEGALDVLGADLATGLLVTKAGHVDERRWRGTPVRVIESAHPLPDERSLAAGRAMLEFLGGVPAGLPVLVLVSGGASALVEVLRPGLTLEDLQRANAWMLANGLPIGEMNRIRRGLSAVKAGGLLAYLGERPVRGLLISDVPGDEPAVIGSGLLVPYAAAPSIALPDWLARMVQAGLATAPTADAAPPLELVATLDDALAAAAERARAAGEQVHHHPGFLEGDAGEQGAAIGEFLLGASPGVHLWGGETTVRLPPDPGRGGRNQHLALALAGRIAGHDGLWCLAAGTDGTDGPTEDAGGLVDGGTWQRAREGGCDPDAALRAADAGTALEAAGDLVNTGPTGTNVMDLVIALKAPERQR